MLKLFRVKVQDVDKDVFIIHTHQARRPKVDGATYNEASIKKADKELAIEFLDGDSVSHYITNEEYEIVKRLFPLDFEDSKNYQYKDKIDEVTLMQYFNSTEYDCCEIAEAVKPDGYLDSEECFTFDNLTKEAQELIIDLADTPCSETISKDKWPQAVTHIVCCDEMDMTKSSIYYDYDYFNV